MKTSIRLAFLAAALSTAAFAAQTTPSTPAEPGTPAAAFPHPRMHARAAAMAERLGLTAEQRTTLQAIRRQTAAAVSTLRADTALTEQQRRTEIAALRQAAWAQMQSVLTPDQQTKLAELRSHPRRLHAMTMRHERADALARRLALTDTQRVQIRNIRQATRASVAPIRANTTLTPEQKRTEVQALVESARAQVRGVLTPAQQQQLDALRERIANRFLMRLG